MLFEAKPELKNIPAILYFIKLYNINEEFYKIGITTKEIASRIKDIRKYKYNIISEIKITLYNAFLKERKFLIDFKEYKYKPKLYFGGHTECFNKEIYNIMFKPTEDIV
ncbi:MAG: GIY-YIG nuclease family protein [Proteobacteria bacterium]|nr:GIY-YIG nuclease family protein [Pseudomonadota bacterium]